MDEPRLIFKKPLPPGVPCKHPGCAAHISHPCEGCGRVAAGMMDKPDPDWKKHRG